MYRDELKELIHNINKTITCNNGSLVLSNYNLDNEKIINIVKDIKYPHLVTSLNLNGNEITSKGIYEIARVLSSLKALNLSGNKIEDNGVEFITLYLKDLECLTLSSCGITEEGAKDISKKLVKLKYLDLEGNDIGIEGVEAIARGLKKVDSLKLSHNGALKNQMELSYGETIVNAIQLLPKSLKTLGFSGYPNYGMEKVVVRCIAYYLPNLERLDFSGNAIGDECLIHISGLTYLKSLDISNNGITDKGVEYISSRMKNLVSLNLSNNGITNKGVEYISSKPNNLVTLKLYGNKIEELKIIDEDAHLHLGKLRSLDISGYKISDRLAYVIG
ncbi:hypothetical protein IB642_07180 [Allofrancisella guangzhouensis]|uniref:hypothetical protein n=1 Tax=Allofrancisella guangzhouensis TaxID=594679 RepID=UPI00068ECF50|nr:hypothetical protein [Allofrancisella guangzhouensis]MBK2027809.1 hypothetical protein [Allofrancisella guangzhouensis]MBK2044799.1 hypothetical protein [Allofrancisella guangzhouensis]MBK2045750.1 hypothetical protein [Allofrancisella guangzhouensis]